MAFDSSIAAANASSLTAFSRSRGDRSEPSASCGRSWCGVCHQSRSAAARRAESAPGLASENFLLISASASMIFPSRNWKAG